MILISELQAPISFSESQNKKEPQASTVILTIMPGVNDLQGEKEEHYEWAKKIDTFQELLEAEKFILVVNKGEKEGEPGTPVESLPTDLGKLDTKMATSLVKATVIVDILNGWKRKEKRQALLTAIDAQIKLMRDFEKHAADLVAG